MFTLKKRHKRIGIIAALLLSLVCAASFIGYSLRRQINLFVFPTDVVNHHVPLNTPVRLGGFVVKGSIHRDPHHPLQVTFSIQDHDHAVTIHYEGALPDLFREEQSVIVLGKLVNPTEFRANQVLAKHDENYKPPVFNGKAP